MVNFKRDNMGYIDLEALGCVYNKGTVTINGETFYYKDSGIGAYKELVIDELAKDFGLNCAEYDLASFSYRCGLISKDLNRGNDQFIPMSELLSEFYHTSNYRTLRQYNNLDDIGVMLEQKFDYPTSKRLIEQLNVLYIFDIIVGNSDRNCTNYGIQYHDGELNIMILDNELSMDSDVLFMNEYQLKRSRGKDDLADISYSAVQDYLKLVSNENLDDIFGRVERKIQSTINEGIKSEFKTFFGRSRIVLSKKIPKSHVKQF